MVSFCSTALIAASLRLCVGIQTGSDDTKTPQFKFSHPTRTYQSNISVSAAGGFGPLGERPPIEIDLVITRANGDTQHSKIYMGGMPGIIYSARRQGKDVDKFILAGVRLEQNEKLYGGGTVEWYATSFEAEIKDVIRDAGDKSRIFENCAVTSHKLSEAYDKYEEEVKKVITEFRLLPKDKATETAAVAAGFKKELEKAVESVQGTEGAGRKEALANALKLFDANTEKMLEPYSLQREGANLPKAISIDPWILRKVDYCGHEMQVRKICRGLGLAEYTLITVFLRCWLEARIAFFIKQFKSGLNISHVVSLLSQRQAVASLQPYTHPYGRGWKALQYEDISWDGTTASIPQLLKNVKSAIGQPSVDFSVSSHYLGAPENVYAAIMKEKGLDLMWPAWEMDPSVPSPGWCKAARYKMFPDLIENLKKSNSVYVHCEGGGGRTGMFVVVLLMELTGCFWLDALKIVRRVAPRAVAGGQQVLWIAWYWKKYTAKLLPLEGNLEDSLNWDTEVPDEMDQMVKLPDFMRDCINHNGIDSQTLRSWLDAERRSMSSMPRMYRYNGKILRSMDVIERSKDRMFVGGVMCVLLYSIFCVILGAVALMLLRFGLSPESKLYPEHAHKISIEMTTHISTKKRSAYATGEWF